MTESADIALRHGYTVRDLHQMTAAAMKADRSGGMDYVDRRDTAWSAIAEALYAADRQPTRTELVQAGWQAIYAEVRDRYRQHGYRDRKAEAGHASAPRFLVFWLEYLTFQPSHENLVTGRLALPQLLSALSSHERKVIGALAAWDCDRAAAAAALGISEKLLEFHMRKARQRCLQLWLGGETPHVVKNRAVNRRRHRGELPPCGTRQAMHRHRSRKEPLCHLCAPIGTDYEREKREKKALQKAANGEATQVARASRAA